MGGCGGVDGRRGDYEVGGVVWGRIITHAIRFGCSAGKMDNAFHSCKRRC